MFVGGNLSFLRWIIDKSIDQLKWLVFGAAILVCFAAAAVPGMRTQQVIPGGLLAVIVILAVGGGLIWKLGDSLSKASIAAFATKRFFYRRLRNQTPLGGQVGISLLAAAVINEHFTSLRFKRQDQSFVAERIVRAMKTGTKVIFVEGVSGAGKTSTALIAVDKLLTDADARISDYARNVLYFDLSVFPGSIKIFIRNCNSGLLHDACVIVDNFHRIDADSIAAFSELIGAGQPQCRALLVLTQPREFVTLSPSANIDAFKVAESNDAWFRLVPPRSADLPAIFPESSRCDAISEALDGLGIPVDDPVRWVAHASLERVFQIAGREQERAIQDLICSATTEGESPPTTLLRLIAAVSALAIHRGVFTESDLRLSLTALAPGWGIFNAERRSLRSEFRRLRRSGFVLEAVGRNRVFVFHQTLAEHFKDRFKNIPTFHDSFQVVGAALRDREWVRQSPLMEWLYAVELGDTEFARRTFTHALCSGAYTMMRRALIRNDDGSDAPRFDYEGGILSEKVGDWSNARKALSGFVARTSTGGDVRAKAIIALIEAEHGPASRTDLEAIKANPAVSEFVRLSARYWLLHLECHEGRFDIPEIEAVLTVLEQNHTQFWDAHGYDFLHLARRVFFDRVRFHYLEGSCDGVVLTKISDRPMARYLARDHVAFTAYKEKFIYGHHVHYDYLFELGALGIKPDVDKTVLPDTSSGDLDGMIQAAIDYYMSAMARFSVFGDKTTEYIKPRLYELKMMRRDADLDDVLPDLNAYRTMIEKSELLDLAPYPDFYFFKFHFKKAVQTLLHMRVHDEESLEMKVYDIEISRAKTALAAAADGFRKSHNRYGISMCRLFTLLVTALDSADFVGSRRELADLGRQAQALGYQRIATVVRAVELKTPSVQDLERIVTYFPLVHQ